MQSSLLVSYAICGILMAGLLPEGTRGQIQEHYRATESRNQSQTHYTDRSKIIALHDLVVAHPSFRCGWWCNPVIVRQRIKSSDIFNSTYLHTPQEAGERMLQLQNPLIIWQVGRKPVVGQRIDQQGAILSDLWHGVHTVVRGIQIPLASIS